MSINAFFGCYAVIKELLMKKKKSKSKKIKIKKNEDQKKNPESIKFRVNITPGPYKFRVNKV